MKNYCNQFFGKAEKLMFTALACLSLTFSGASQVVKNVANGATTIDLTVNAAKSGKFYYAIFTASQGSLSGDLLKQNALSATNTIKVKAGSMNFNSNDINVDQIRLILNLTQGTQYFIYGVYESSWLGLETVEFFQVSLPMRQPAMSYISAASGISGTTVRYLLYKPESALKKPLNPQPLLIFCHGNGEIGTDINLVKRNGPPMLIQQGKDLDFVVASPQIYWPITWNNLAFLDEFLAKVKQEQNIDTNRIYITGLSGGGAGMYNLSRNRPTKVAAIVPVSGVSAISTPCAIKDIPMWGFHNSNDNTVSLYNLTVVVNAINACNPKPLVAPLVTIYPVVSHNAWTAAYNTPRLYAWLLEKSKNDKLNAPPTANAGNDISVATEATLAGSATDNQSIASYFWEQKSGPEATIVNPDSRNPMVKDLKQGNYVFKMTARDNSGASAIDEVAISASGVSGITPLSVYAGGDVVKTVTTKTITLTGTVTNPNGSITSLTWTKVSGPAINLINTSGLSLIVSTSLLGDYAFKLTAYNSLGKTAFDQVNLKIVDAVTVPAQTIAGIGLTAKYFNNKYLSGIPVLTTVDSVINFDFGTGSPSTLVNNDNFSAIWEGQIEAPVSGKFNFYTISDDGVRLFVDDILIIDNWTPHAPTTNTGVINLAAAQKYKIKLQFYEDLGGATIKLLWDYPGQITQIVPKSRLNSQILSTTPNPSAFGNGLSGSYYNNKWLSGTAILSRIDTTVSFDWAARSPNAIVNVDNFSVRWEGQVLAPVSGSYTFSTTSDDGIRLWVNNTLIVDKWTPHYIAVHDGTINLQAGQKYSIKMEYYEVGGGAVAKLAWSFPGSALQTVPKSKLFSSIASPVRNEALSLSELSNSNDWKIYPNPTSDILNIIAPTEISISEVSLFNTIGELVYASTFDTSTEAKAINVRGFMPGMYILIVRSQYKNATHRIMIE